MLVSVVSSIVSPLSYFHINISWFDLQAPTHTTSSSPKSTPTQDFFSLDFPSWVYHANTLYKSLTMYIKYALILNMLPDQYQDNKPQWWGSLYERKQNKYRYFGRSPIPTQVQGSPFLPWVLHSTSIPHYWLSNYFHIKLFIFGL